MKTLFEAMSDKLNVEISKELQEELQSKLDVEINEKVKEIVTLKEAQMDENSAKEMSEFKESVVESLDQYIEYAAAEFIEENKVALEAKHKVEAAEKILEKTKSIFEEIGLTVPEDKIDVVKSLEEKVVELEESLNSKVEENIELKKQIVEFEKAVSFQKRTASLTESTIEKVHDLLEGLEFTNISDFNRKLNIIIEKVEKKPVVETNNTENLDESFDTKSSIDKYLP